MQPEQILFADCGFLNGIVCDGIIGIVPTVNSGTAPTHLINDPSLQAFHFVTKKLLGATDVCEILGVSRSTAYRIIKQLNDQLEKKGKIIVAGKISARYFYENVYL